MSNNFLIEPNGADVMITVNGKSVILPKDILIEKLIGPLTVSPFWKRLAECASHSPDVAKELNEFVRQNKSNPDLLHRIMDEIKGFYD